MKTHYSFRPHHFLCTLSFKGMGYSPQFIENYKEIVQEISSNPLTLISVTKNLDSICGACPNHKGAKCKTDDKIKILDEAHAEILHIKDNDVLSWEEARERIAKHFTIEKFHKACETCSWKRLGICENALKKHLITQK